MSADKTCRACEALEDARPMLSLDEKIVAALERIHTSTRAVLQQAGHRHGLSPLQAQILAYLDHHSTTRLSVSTLAESFRVSKPTVSDSVHTLLAKHLLTKVPDRTDARRYTLTCTPAGRHTARLLAADAAPFLASVGQLAPAQQAALWEALLQLIRTMQHQGLIPLTRMCFSCRHFAEDVEETPYYCHLMQAPLTVADLRIDCAEHERAAHT